MTTLTIAWREVRALLASPLAYVVATLWLAIGGLFFSAEIDGLLQARIDGWLQSVTVLLLFLAPLLAMRSIAEERRSGTLEVLLSGPVSDLGVVLGKYLGLLAFYAALLAVSAVFPLLLAAWGDPDPGPILTGYLGLFLLGGASLAVSLLASAFTRHQVVAGVLGLVMLIILWVLDSLARQVEGDAGLVLAFLATGAHIDPFFRGLIRLEDVVYSASVAVVCVFSATRVLESRRWL